MTSATVVQVGCQSGPAFEAAILVHRYLNHVEDGWSYPAYDGYPGGPASAVSEQDLFAPALLNAGISSLKSYYAFVEALDELNRRLDRVPLGVSLPDATEEDLQAVIQVVGLLDDVRIPGIRLTKFSKVVHRKRPALIPLYDEHIRRCYQDPGSENGAVAPVPAVKGRSYRDFMRAWLPAVRHDLTSQGAIWSEFAALAPADGPEVTPLRALDIVGWALGQKGRTAWAFALRQPCQPGRCVPAAAGDGVEPPLDANPA